MLRKFDGKDKYRLTSNDFIEFKCKFLRNSLLDTLIFLKHAIEIGLNSFQEYSYKQIDLANISTDNNEIFIAQYQIEVMKNSIKIQEKYKELYAALKVIDEVINVLNKTEVIELRVEIVDSQQLLRTIIVAEKDSFIGNIDKVYGHEFNVIGKVIKYKENDTYSSLESSVFGQLNKDILSKIENALEPILNLFSNDSLVNSKSVSNNISSQLEEVKSNISIKGNILKILPVAIYA